MPIITTNDLIRLFLPIIQNGLVAAGYTNPVPVVKQNYQPTTQGVNTNPTVYFFKVGDHRYGFMQRIDVWDSVHSQETHTEAQMYETTFQISALVISDPLNPSYTASDLVNSVAMIMASDATLLTLTAAGVSIYRITDVRNPYFTDDMDRYEASPGFDFTLTYQQSIVTVDPVIESVQYSLTPI